MLNTDWFDLQLLHPSALLDNLSRFAAIVTGEPKDCCCGSCLGFNTARGSRFWGEEQAPHIFTCCRCHKLTAWCRGAADDMPDACDDCWAAENLEEWSR